MFHSADGTGGPTGHDISTELTDLAPYQLAQLRGRLDGEGIESRWSGNRLTIDSAYEDRVTTLVEQVRASGPGGANLPGAPGGPPPYGGPAYGGPGGPPPNGGPAYGAGPAYGGSPAYPAYPAPYPPGNAPAPYGPSGYAPAPYPPGPTTNGNAIGSLVVAVGAWAVCPVVLAIVAIVLAGKAKREIAASQGTQTGDGLALAGQIVAWLNIGLYGVGLLAFVVLAIAAGASGAR